MGIAIIGLISFQLYWIDNLITANEERLQKDVLEALYNVANKLEKQETIRAFHKLNYLSQVRSYDSLEAQTPLLTASDTQLTSPKATLQQSGNQQIFVVQDSLYGGSFEVMFSLGGYGSHFFPNFNAPQPREGEILSRDMRIRELERRLEKVSRRYEQTFEVVNELMGSHIPLNSRFNPNQLDSLLKSELENKGIDIKYEYGVLQPKQKQFLLLTRNTNPKELALSNLKTNLFPNDLFNDESQLIIRLADEKGFIIKKVWSAMASSGILVLVILFCFGYSIKTILRQKKLSEMKNDFINNMTHELKTPISTVSLAVEALCDKEIEQRTLREKYVKVIGEENKRLGDQVEKVLQIAAIDRNDFNLKEELLSMKETVQNAAEHIFMQVDKRDGRINIVDTAKKDAVKGDEMHVTNIIINLLENANKYSPDSPNITLKTDSDDTSFYLSIQDRGIGMTKEQQKHIFEKFYRVPTGNVHNVKGFGLGLAYVQKIVAAHGGTINVDSEYGKGSKFLIKLPLAKHEA